jgi:hypothetical protein
MQRLTQSLWPIRYKPFDDELLSCWLVRLAHGHGLKVLELAGEVRESRNPSEVRSFGRQVS